MGFRQSALNILSESVASNSDCCYKLILLCSTKTAVNATTFLKSCYIFYFRSLATFLYFTLQWTVRTVLHQQDRLCNYSGKLGRVFAPIILVERNKYRGADKSLAGLEKNTIQRQPFFVRRGGNCCLGDLVGWTIF